MVTKEKWVLLFEKVIGRKPTPTEFKLGKESGYDCKQIKRIAGYREVEQHTVLPTAENPYPKKENKTNLHSNHKKNQILVSESIEQTDYPPFSKISVKKYSRWIIYLLLISIFIFMFNYIKSQNSMEVTVGQFTQAIDKHEFEKVAVLLSSDEEKWSKEEAQKFITTLENSDVSIKKELTKILESGEKSIYVDKKGNKLFGVEEVGKKYGIFPEYQIKAYPIEISFTSNLEDVVINNKKIPKKEIVSLGSYHFLPIKFGVVGNTKTSDFNFQIEPDLSQVTNNKLLITLNSTMRKLNVNIENKIGEISDVKIYANDQIIATSFEEDIEVVENQKFKLSASFVSDGILYRTEIKTVEVPSDSNQISVQLKLLDSDSKKLEEVKKENQKQDINQGTNFGVEQEIALRVMTYREDINRSLATREDHIGRNFTSDSANYILVRNWIINDSANDGIARYDSITNEIRNIQDLGSTVTCNLTYTTVVTYVDGHRSTISNTRQYIFRRVNGTLLIFDFGGV